MHNFGYGYILFFMQIATFLNTTIKYNRQPAYGIVLDSVPGLSVMAKQQLKAHVSDKSRGVKNNPRFFSTQTKELLVVSIA